MSLVAVVMTGENVTGYKASLVGKSVTGYKVSLVATVMTEESVTGSSVQAG